MKNKHRKKRPEPPRWFNLDTDNCWFCKNKNNCNGCSILKQYKKRNYDRYNQNYFYRND